MNLGINSKEEKTFVSIVLVRLHRTIETSIRNVVTNGSNKVSVLSQAITKGLIRRPFDGGHFGISRHENRRRRPYVPYVDNGPDITTAVAIIRPNFHVLQDRGGGSIDIVIKVLESKEDVPNVGL